MNPLDVMRLGQPSKQLAQPLSVLHDRTAQAGVAPVDRFKARITKRPVQPPHASPAGHPAVSGHDHLASLEADGRAGGRSGQGCNGNSHAGYIDISSTKIASKRLSTHRKMSPRSVLAGHHCPAPPPPRTTRTISAPSNAPRRARCAGRSPFAQQIQPLLRHSNCRGIRVVADTHHLQVVASGQGDQSNPAVTSGLSDDPQRKPAAASDGTSSQLHLRTLAGYRIRVKRPRNGPNEFGDYSKSDTIYQRHCSNPVAKVTHKIAIVIDVVQPDGRS